jgi:hypothetical protein
MSVLSPPEELDIGPARHGGGWHPRRALVVLAVVVLVVGAVGGYVLRSATEASRTVTKTVTRMVSPSPTPSSILGRIYFDGKQYVGVGTLSFDGRQGVYVGPTELAVGMQWDLTFASTVDNGLFTVNILHPVPSWERFRRDAAEGNWPPPYMPAAGFLAASGFPRFTPHLTKPGVYGVYCSRGEPAHGRPFVAVAMIHVSKSVDR